MDRLDEVMVVLKRLGRRHGRILPLTVVFKTIISERLYTSRQSISECLRKLQAAKRIRPINFGVDIELLEEDQIQYTQSSLNGFKRPLSAQ